MTTTIRGLMRVESVTEYGYSKAKTVKFRAMYDTSTEEGRRFAEATPLGNIELFVSNPVALEQFKIGKDFYVDFVAKEPAEQTGYAHVVDNN